MQTGFRRVALAAAALALAAAGGLLAADTAKAAPKHVGGVKWGSSVSVVADGATAATGRGRTWS